MVLESLLFWFWGWVCLELYHGRFLATQLALVLSLLLALTVVLLLLGLDLLAVFIGSVYSSVFIAVSLIALQFGPFWAVAARASEGGTGALKLRPWVAVLLATGGWVFFRSGAPLTGWEGALLWQDLWDEPGVALTLQSTTLHWFFFRCFILEALALNLYLFLGLVGVVLLISIRVSGRYATEGWNRGYAPHLFQRIRMVARIRRQVRRTPASRLKHQR